MIMQSNLLTNTVDEIITAAFAETDGDLLVVDPTAETIETIIQLGFETDEHPTLRTLAEESVLKSVMNDFLVASRAADLVENGHLSLRVLEADSNNSLLVSETSVTALVGAGDIAGAISSDDDEFVAGVYDSYRAVFEDAETHGLRTPAISQVRDTLAADIGDATRDDFNTVMSSMESARGNGQGLDEVTVSLLVAARNEELLYDISKWGEDIGIASKATFSRTKTRLEDGDLIDTEKVPIDVGRPRLRLKLGDERLTTANTDDLAGVTNSILD